MGPWGVACSTGERRRRIAGRAGKPAPTQPPSNPQRTTAACSATAASAAASSSGEGGPLLLAGAAATAAAAPSSPAYATPPFVPSSYSHSGINEACPTTSPAGGSSSDNSSGGSGSCVGMWRWDPGVESITPPSLRLGAQAAAATAAAAQQQRRQDGTSGRQEPLFSIIPSKPPVGASTANTISIIPPNPPVGAPTVNTIAFWIWKRRPLKDLRGVRSRTREGKERGKGGLARDKWSGHPGTRKGEERTNAVQRCVCGGSWHVERRAHVEHNKEERRQLQQQKAHMRASWSSPGCNQQGRKQLKELQGIQAHTRHPE